MTPMTGLDLESFLQLLRADLGAWLSLGVIALLLALMTWTTWGSRRALRKCLVLSVLVHVGLVGYWFSDPSLRLALTARTPEPSKKEGIRQIRVTPISDKGTAPATGPNGGQSAGRLASWDRPSEALAMASPTLRAPRRDAKAMLLATNRPDAAVPDAPSPVLSPPQAPAPEARSADAPELIASPAAPVGDDEIARVEPNRPAAEEVAPAPDGRLRANRPDPPEPPAMIARRPPAAPGMPEAPTPSESSPIPEPRADPDLAPPVDLAANPSPEPADPAATAPTAEASEPVAIALPQDPDVRGPARRVPKPPAPKPSPRPPVGSGPGRGVGGPVAGVASPSDRPTPSANDPIGPVAPADGPTVAGSRTPSADPEPALILPDADPRRRARPAPTAPRQAPVRPARGTEPIAMARVVPSGSPKLPDIRGATGGRPLSDVPEVYRSRLDPNRSALAKRAGATAASEQAVERALVWLSKHQDADGSWDGKVARQADGTPLPGDDDYTVHCPPGDLCPGECFYWEADTALTGLALLAYLGAGYTHTDGAYADTVAKGLDYLILSQKADGDLRGRSRAVGMYCHAMASLALCEAYALTADDRLRVPVERAVAFLAKAQSPLGGWRYAPGEAMGDSSILGWVVLVFKSARYAGVSVPRSAEAGAIAWLDKVADGRDGGLARYQPAKPVTETMTAEAWVSRLFLGVGGRGAAGDEAAAYLMARPPDQGEYNIYYWYYGTLAMYLHGGEAWPRWNAQVRDQLVRLQKTKGHQAGSWDPDATPYGSRGGRIYGTALAALTLEVYYRYLRLYDEPSPAPIMAPAPERPADATLKRAGGARPAAGGWKKKE